MLRLSQMRWLILTVLLLITVCTSCVEGPRPFDHGIRVWSYIDVVDRPPQLPIIISGQLPPHAVTISGVGHFGELQSTTGPPSGVSGTDTRFDGETNKFGFDDHETIRDNAFWDLSVSYNFAMPHCGVAHTPVPFRVPQGGQQVFAICYEFTG